MLVFFVQLLKDVSSVYNMNIVETTTENQDSYHKICIVKLSWFLYDS